MRQAFAIIGAILMLYSIVPYLVDIVKKHTKPNVVSWLTWTLLTGLGSAAAFASGEPKTALITLASALSTLAVVLLGLKYGIAKMTLFDALCQAGVVVGLILWFVFNSPVLAIYAAVTIDFIGILPTFRHSWANPEEETWQTFAISSLAVAFTLLSITHYSVESLLYPIYLFFGDTLVTFLIIIRRHQLGISLSRRSKHMIVREEI